ncbi:hypothetical protein HKX48_008076 [Thoreauomyces humboldtii]|nr:hypothetical protein HKX48_008076 [Thoreauomyces humboldtii]
MTSLGSHSHHEHQQDQGPQGNVGGVGVGVIRQSASAIITTARQGQCGQGHASPPSAATPLSAGSGTGAASPAAVVAADSNPYQFITLNQSPRQRTSRNYVLKLRQQPKHSRMCGFGEKVDRRPLDPPPIIQLEIKNTSFADENSYLYNPYYFMYASLIAPEGEEELHLLRDGKTRSTTGSIVSSLYRLKDLDNKDGAFFVFPDLSVRMEGTYRLKFSLFEIINTEIYHCTSICSDIFNVYPAKKFPGMEESTFLSRTFAEQGLKIRIRKELRMRKGRGKKGNNDGDDSGDGGKKRSRKKSRRGSAGSDNGSESGYSDEGRPEAAQKRRTGNSGSSKDGKGGYPQGYSGYDRFDPSRPMGGMGRPDPRHYGHMGHEHQYPHYGPMGLPPKGWHGHGDPYQGGISPHGYPPMHYDPNAPPYPPPPTAGTASGPPGPEQEGGGYPLGYNPNQRPGYPPPHMYGGRELDGQMMDWHHREYRHPGYGPPLVPYMGGGGHYEDPNARPPAPPAGPGQPPGEHPSMPPLGASNSYYDHHPGSSANHGDYKAEPGHPPKYPPPSNYGHDPSFHIPGPHVPGGSSGADPSAGRPISPSQHPNPHGEHGAHGMDKSYGGPPPHGQVPHQGYYLPYPPPNMGPNGMPYYPSNTAGPTGARGTAPGDASEAAQPVPGHGSPKPTGQDEGQPGNYLQGPSPGGPPATTAQSTQRLSVPEGGGSALSIASPSQQSQQGQQTASSPGGGAEQASLQGSSQQQPTSTTPSTSLPPSRGSDGGWL